VPPSHLRRAIGLALVAALGLACGCSQPPPPNVVMISIDTLRADAVGAYGGPVPTPGLDRLAREGVILQWAFAPTPTTAPSHATLFTGQHVQRHGTLGNGPITLGELPLERAFRESGRATAGFVSSYVLSRELGWSAGFTHFDDAFKRERGDLGEMAPELTGDLEQFKGKPLEREGIATTSAVREWIDSAPEPFFLFVHFFDPHTPYKARRRNLAKLRDVPFDLANRGAPGYDDATLARAVRGYYAEVLFVDEGVQALLDALDQRAITGRTLVSVTADHGEGLGQHAWMGHTVHLYDEQIRIPWILRWPGVLPAGLRIASPVGLVDVAPTLAELAGVALPGPVDGRSIAAALRSGTEPAPQPVFGIRPRFEKPYRDHFGEKRYVRTDRWKLIRGEDTPDELYDLVADPRELRNRVAEEPEVAKELRALLDEHAAGTPAAKSQSGLTVEQKDALRALGYGD
jgi:choline-sulfatase